MKRSVLIITAFILAVAALAGISACGKSDPVKDPAAPYTPTAKETAKIIELARAFRIYGDFDRDKVFPISKAENMIYCLYTCSLPESDVRGYGKVAFSEADELIERTLELDISGSMRTKFKPNEIQLVYSVGENYYVFRTDDSGFVYEITAAELIFGETGERTGVRATVKITDPDGAFSITLDLNDDDMFVFTVKKSQVQFYE